MFKSKRNKSIVIAVAVIIIAVIFILVYRGKNTESDETAEAEHTVDSERESANAELSEEETDDVSEAYNMEEEEAEEKFEYLVCVPVEYMSLRKTPGLGDDVIAELTAGTYLKWYGQTETVDEKDYYYVKVEDTNQEGFVAERFCVAVDFVADESELKVVQTNDAIYSYEDMSRDIQELLKLYPDILNYEIIGESVDERNIYALTIGNEQAENHIMVQAAIHGREYMNAQLAMKMVEYYCRYYYEGKYKNISYSDLFEKTAIHIIPMSNPDGVTISQFGVAKINNPYIEVYLKEAWLNDWQNLCYEEDSNGDLNWVDHYKDPDFDLTTSKNPREITFEEYLRIWKANANGVDLNNNFDAGWEDIDLKSWISYGSFKGYYPVSEPETQALVNYALRRDYRCFISYHSRGQLIYFDVKGNSVQNSEISTKLAELLEEHIKYEPVNTNKAYNVNLGGFSDWIQLALDKPSVTIESGKKPCPLQIEEFTGIWNRHRESWAMLLEQFY